jgi:hypothetical protein
MSSFPFRRLSPCRSVPADAVYTGWPLSHLYFVVPYSAFPLLLVNVSESNFHSPCRRSHVTFGPGVGGVGRPGIPEALVPRRTPMASSHWITDSQGGTFRRCTQTTCVAGRFPGPRIRARPHLAEWLWVCFACVLGSTSLPSSPIRSPFVFTSACSAGVVFRFWVAVFLPLVSGMVWFSGLVRCGAVDRHGARVHPSVLGAGSTVRFRGVVPFGCLIAKWCSVCPVFGLMDLRSMFEPRTVGVRGSRVFVDG